MGMTAGRHCGHAEAVATKGKHCAHCQVLWPKRLLPLLVSAATRAPPGVTEHTSMGTPVFIRGATLAASSDMAIQAITAHVQCRVCRRKFMSVGL